MFVTQVRISFAVASHRGFGPHATNDCSESSDFLNSYVWCQVFTSGWKTGARNRVRAIHGTGKFFRYIEKLFAGGYLSAEDFDHAAAMYAVAYDRARPYFGTFIESNASEELIAQLQANVYSGDYPYTVYYDLPKGMINTAIEGDRWQAVNLFKK